MEIDFLVKDGDTVEYLIKMCYDVYIVRNREERVLLRCLNEIGFYRGIVVSGDTREKDGGIADSRMGLVTALLGALSTSMEKISASRLTSQ